MTSNEDVQGRTPFVNSDDPTLLLIKGNIEDREDCKKYIKRTANAIFQVASKHDVAHLRCVGAASLNNATKALIIAIGEAKTKGVNLYCVPSFQTVNFGEGGEKTSIVLEVRAFSPD